MKKLMGILVSMVCLYVIIFHPNVMAAENSVKEQEVNDSVEKANLIEGNTRIIGTIGEEEEDIYKFALEDEDTVEFEFSQKYPLSSVALFNEEKDFVGYIYNASGNEWNLKYSELPEGLYYLQVFENSSKTAPSYEYELKVIMEQSENSEASFPDVKNDHYAYEAVAWAKEQGIVKGYVNGNFGPNDQVTEAQFAVMLKNFFDAKSGKAQLNKETPTKNWTDDVYNSLASYGVPLNGYFDDTIRNQPIKRGLVAQSLVYLGYESLDLEKAIQFLLDEKISTGQNPDGKDNALEFFGYSNELTRAEAVTFLYRMNLHDFNEISETASNTYENEKGYTLDELAKQAEAKIHGDLSVLTKNEAKKIVNDLLSGIVGTFDRLGEKYDWSFENAPDFSILRPELLKYASTNFTDGFLKDVKDDFYCSCDVLPYPDTDLDIRFTLHENTSNQIVASSVEFDNMISSGSTVYYTIVKENGKWVMDNYKWVSAEKEPIHLTWEEVKVNQEKNGSKVELLNTTTFEGKKIYIFKYAGTNTIMGIYADNTGYLLEVPSALLP